MVICYNPSTFSRGGSAGWNPQVRNEEVDGMDRKLQCRLNLVYSDLPTDAWTRRTVGTPWVFGESRPHGSALAC
jgi:hypothetical protein